MRDRTKLIVASAALVVACVASSRASAGNLRLPGCEYYSLQIFPGDSFSYTGSEQDTTLTVDDITYSVAIDPCELTERCEFFTAEEITSYFLDQDVFENQVNMPLPPDPFGGTASGGTSTTRRYTNQVLAKGADMRLQMVETDGQSSSVFDSLSHTTYGLFIDKIKRETFATSAITQYTSLNDGGPGSMPVRFPDKDYTASSTAGIGLSEAIGLSTWAVNTSESRHYQSPQIVQPGHSVALIDLITIGSSGTYSQAYALVKGRVYFGTEGAPVENHDITVTHP